MKEPRLKTVYVCSNCGETSPRWMGRCPSCGSWNTMNEDVVAQEPKAGTAAAKMTVRQGGDPSVCPAAGRYQHDRRKEPHPYGDHRIGPSIGRWYRAGRSRIAQR